MLILKKNKFAKEIILFFKFILKTYFDDDNKQINKLVLHFFKSHFLVIFFIRISFIYLNFISLILYQKKILKIQFDQLKNILKIIENFKFLQSNKIIELFHAITAIHLNGEEVKTRVKVNLAIKNKNFFENIVIGSGPGGSITANQLNSEKKDVLIIERGEWFEHFKLKHPGSELMSKWNNGALAGALGNVKIQYASANCFGGGSEINSGLYHEPDEDFLNEWSQRFNTKNLNKEKIHKYCQLTKSETNVIYQNKVDELSKLILHGSKINNWKIEEIPRWISYNQDKIQKKSMTKTYLKTYLENGGKIMLNTNVERIKKDKNHWSLSLNKKNVIKCKNLFLCCGSIENTFLLKKSNIIKKKNEILFHPMIKVIAKFPKKINHYDSEICTQQITEFFPRFILGNAASGLQFLKISSLNNKSLYEKIKNEWEFMSIFHATFSVGKGTVYSLPFIKDPIVKYEINNKEIINIKDGLKKLCKLLFDSGAEYIFPIIKDSSTLFKDNYIDHIDKIKNVKEFNFSSVHILGGFPMGENTKCIVDSYGKFFSEKNLYINDSSLICNKLVKNPQGTVMAIALRNVQNFLNNHV